MIQESNVIKQIFDIAMGIDKNIDKNKDDRGLLSQNILDKLRNLVEHIALYTYNNDTGQGLNNDYKNLKTGEEHISDKSKYIVLKRFHKLLQISVSHYTPNEENAERLMLKYLSHLLKIREFCENNFGIKILQNLNDFPMNLDNFSLQYYELVAEKIERIDSNLKCESDKFYIYSSKPFVVGGKIL